LPLLKYPIVLPSGEVAEALGDAVSPLFKQLKALDEQSRTLAAIRDVLLPKLLSGELSVVQAEQAVEATA
jgi:type I restriction enzyme S subunit